MISQERLKIEVKLLLSANRKSYMPYRLAQQQMTLNDLECLKSTSSTPRAISVVAEVLVYNACYWNSHGLHRCDNRCQLNTLLSGSTALKSVNGEHVEIFTVVILLAFHV